MITAIVYTTNTGFTAEYAKMLGGKTGLPFYSAKEAKREVKNGAEVIYLGWLAAGTVKGLKNALKTYDVRVVGAVGMSLTGTQDDYVRKTNALPESIALYTLQGGFAIEKLRGFNKLLMKIMKAGVTKGLSEKTDRTPEDDDMLDLMQNGGSRVSEENLSGLLGWYNGK